MTPSDVTKCSFCNFPAIGEEMKVVIGIVNKCPLCDRTLEVGNLEKIELIPQYLKSRKILQAEENKDQSQNNVTNIITDEQEKIDL